MTYTCSGSVSTSEFPEKLFKVHDSTPDPLTERREGAVRNSVSTVGHVAKGREETDGSYFGLSSWLAIDFWTRL